MDILSLSEPVRAIVAAAMAAVPAIVAYVRGRQVARFADDPALPERLAEGRRVTTGSLVFAIAALVVLTGSASIWAIPLALIAYVAAGLPLRRIVYNETWSLAVYLSFAIRLFTAGWGFWLLVATLPSLALWAGERGWVVALTMGAGLMMLAPRQMDLIRWLIGARPIADDAIRARFARLAAIGGLAAPSFEVVDLKGGSVANAFALPSPDRPAVVFSGPLLARLDADEADAICAHELAHLEYHNPRRMRQRRLVSRSLVAAGALLAPAMQWLGPSAAWMLAAGWPVVVLIALAALAKDRQKHETASDLRAIALTGNPEALVRALVKLHALARVPRRRDADLERHLSHPSLKKRIQDIRAAAGTPPAALGDTAVFDSTDGAARAVFGDDSLEWIEGASASHRLRYDRLKELRIAATREGATTLLAADRTGRRWQMPVRANDVPRIQAVLDIVDARVGAGDAPASVIEPLLIRAATFTVFIVSINAGLIAAAMVLAMTLARPAAPLLAASGFAAIAGAILTWRDPGTIYGFIPDDFQTLFAAVLLAAGALLVWLAYARRREQVPARVWQLVGLVAAAALASWLPPLAAVGFDAVSLHRAARGWSSSVVMPFALAGALLCLSRRVLRVAAAIAAVAGVTAGAAGSQAFLDRFGDDPLLVPAAGLPVRTLDRPVSEFTVPFAVSGLQLSPSGRSIAVLSRRLGSRPAIHIGRAGQALIPIDGDGVAFIDDDSAMVWTVDGSRTELRRVAAAAPLAADWQLQITGLPTPAVSLDAKAKRWRLASPGLSVVEAREGVIGSEQIEVHRWRVPQGHGSPFIPIAVTGDRALALEPRPDLASIADPVGGLVFVLATMPRWRSTMWELGPDGAVDRGTSRLELECHRLAVGGACQIFDASRTRFFAVDAAAHFKAVASLPGRFFVGEELQGSWITGWYQSGLVAVRLDPVNAIRVAGPNGARAQMLAASDRAAAGVWYQIPPASGMQVGVMYEQTGTSVVRIYGIE